MDIRVLGPLWVGNGGRQVALGGRRQRAVLAGLAVHAGRVVTTDHLIGFVWGEHPPPTARKSLQTYVARLRALLGPGVITGAADGYLLDIGSADLDADQFATLAADGRDLVATEPAAAWEILGRALALWRGPPLADIDADGDLTVYAEHLQEARQEAVEARLDAGLALGRHRELTAELRGLVDAHPLRERLWGQLMLALYRSGRQGEALAAFQRCRQILGAELGIEPSSGLRRLEERILRQDPDLDVAEPGPSVLRPTGVPRNPYKGLRAFAEADAADFFGREELVGDLARRVERGARFLALVGPSGCGKSSVALAGLVPALRRRSAGQHPVLVATMTPGTHPFAQLEAALARAAPTPTAPSLGHLADPDDDLALLRAVLGTVPDQQSELILVIDQLEELLTGAIAADVVDAFLRNLVEAVEDPHGQLTAIVTLRADFFDRALRQPALADLLAQGMVNVPPLRTDEIQAAVVRPATAVGMEVEPELVAELAAETAQHPSSLPLLQFVLTELASRAAEPRLTLAALRAGGGMRGALARQCEELYADLTDAGREATRLAFLQLVALNEGDEPVRRVVAIDDLHLSRVNGRAGQDAVDALVRARLLVSGRDALSGRATLEVAHEAVFREWPRCARWIEDARADIQMALALERAAADWTAADRSSDYLLTGARLRLYEDWARRTELGTPPTAAEFLAASSERRHAQERAEAARRQREQQLERRAVYRLRAAAGILALLVVVATALSAVAVRSSVGARRERAAALSAAAEILVRQLSFAAVAEAGRDPELSLLLALHAVQAAATSQEDIPAVTVEALHWGLQGQRVQYPVTGGDVLLLVGADGPRGAFDLPTNELVELARGQVSRDLTPEECATYLSSDRCPELAAGLGASAFHTEPRASAAGADLAGTTVRVLGPYSNESASAFRAEFAAFEEATGIKVDYRESSNPYPLMEAGEVQRTVDIIVAVPQPGLVASEAAAGRLMDIGQYLPADQLANDYGSHMLSLGTVGADGRVGATEGNLHALPVSGNIKSLIWYAPSAFAKAGYKVPATWDELMELSDRIVADGATPWCFAEESGPASGWPATDWVEDILLKDQGPEVYDGWVARTIPFSDPRVRAAFERLGALFSTPGYVHGGTKGALETSFFDGAGLLVGDPPDCYLYHQASFLPDNVPLGLDTDDIAAFPTPVIDEDYAEGVVIGGDMALVYTDRPEVRALVAFFASPEYGHEMAARLSGFLAVNSRFARDSYPEPWRRKASDALVQGLQSGHARFDASDTMPPWLGRTAFWSAMLDYLDGGPGTLDAVLHRLDAVRDPATP